MHYFAHDNGAVPECNLKAMQYMVTEWLSVLAKDGKIVSVSSEGVFSDEQLRARQFDKEDPLYRSLVDLLRDKDPHVLCAIRMLESARKDARYNYFGWHPDLEGELVAWRRGKAREANYPAYLILQQKVLLAIADTKPVTEEELLSIPGFGPGLFARYGQEILAMTNKY